MPGQAERVVLLPRFTALVGPASGTTDFYSPFFRARDFASATVTAWMGTSPGGSQTFTLQESPDLATWRDTGTLTVSSSQGLTSFSALDAEWLRLKASLSSGARFSCWAVGEFALRGA